MWTSILCPTKLDAIFHDLKCLEGQCNFCGIDMLLKKILGVKIWWVKNVMKKLCMGEQGQGLKTRCLGYSLQKPL